MNHGLFVMEGESVLTGLITKMLDFGWIFYYTVYKARLMCLSHQLRPFRRHGGGRF